MLTSRIKDCVFGVMNMACTNSFGFCGAMIWYVEEPSEGEVS